MLEGMIKSEQKIITLDKGSVMHFLKVSDDGFVKFGEAYFSLVKSNSIKAWKLHKNMTLNLTVPVGKVQFCFFDGRNKSKTFGEKIKIILSQEPYFRLTVPPGIWFGFKGLSEDVNLICNIADIVHDQNEVLRKDLNEIDMDWSLE